MNFFNRTPVFVKYLVMSIISYSLFMSVGIYIFLSSGPMNFSKGLLLVGYLFLIYLFSLTFVVNIIRKMGAFAHKIYDEFIHGNYKVRFENELAHPNGLGARFNDMADAIERLIYLLRNEENAKIAFLQEIGHDLRTPLTSIRLILESLKTSHVTMTDKERDQFYDTGINETLYLSRLIEDLLFISGVSHPQYNASSHFINISEVLTYEINLFKNLDEIIIQQEIEQDVRIYGDSLLFKRLFQNALSNAVDFANKNVHVTLKKVNDFVIVQVRDDGEGINKDLVESFGQKRTNRTINLADNDRISLGLGSVIMKKISDLYEGDLSIQSGADHYFATGTTLNIKLKMK